jgi:hypothetical protein
MLARPTGTITAPPPVTIVPVHTASSAASVSPAALADSDGWQLLAPGLEQRTYVSVKNHIPPIVVLRVNSAMYGFRVHYRPGAPLNLNEWRQALPDAAAFVNANFFGQDNTVNGLLVADGKVYGRSYQGSGGMFQVQSGHPRVRSLLEEPYLGESLEQAVQAFPVLVLNGASNYANPDSTDASRRTVIAQDSSGGILLMTVSLLVTLPELSAYLPTTDMHIVNALNLDGGRSTMMSISRGVPYALPSFQAVPAVLAVYPK